MKTYKPPFTITEKILTLVSQISEYIVRLTAIVKSKRVSEVVLITCQKTLYEAENVPFRWDMTKLKEQGKIRHVGSLKSGYWEVI